jgi:hypothetical protein
MDVDQFARVGAIDLVGDLAKTGNSLSQPRHDSLRQHVLNRNMQSKSGRLYYNEDWDFDIPALELYAAR